MIQEWIAEARVRIEQARLLVLKTAWLMDTVGNKGAHTEIQAIKIVTPAMAEWVIDKAITAHGAAGISQDFPLAMLWANARSLRFADGPDEVHKRSLARRELRRYRRRRGRAAEWTGPTRRGRASEERASERRGKLGGSSAPGGAKKQGVTIMPDNQSRVAIVTGAARGIGAAAARRLAADGMAVAVLDLDADACKDTVDAIVSAGGRAIAVGADVSQADQVAGGGGRRSSPSSARPRCWSTTPGSCGTTCCSRCPTTTGTWSWACTCAARS